jgi:glutamate-1-semialdehyde 2,1-aminomutase
METKKDIKRTTSEALFEKSKTYFPGGVNSPVRAFKSVEGSPLFIKKGDGCIIWDEDDNQFIDFCCSWGPLILGHNHPKVYEKIIGALQNGASKAREVANDVLNRVRIKLGY